MMYLRPFRLIALLLGAGLVTSSGFLLAFGAWPATDEQYAVYSAYIQEILDEESRGFGSNRATLNLAVDSAMVSELSRFDEWRFMAGSLPGLSMRPGAPNPFLVWGLFFGNLASSRFEHRFRFSATYELIEPAHISANVCDYRSLSKISFSLDETEALFHTQQMCKLCGGAEYVLMHKIDGKWRTATRFSTWS